MSDNDSLKPYRDLFFIWIGITCLFALTYWVLNRIPGHGVIEPLSPGPAILHWYDALYFSVTTGTTVGFGDIIPIGASRFFTALQALVSFVLLAVLVSRFASRKQDIALERIHSLSEDASFNNIRQGLFIARKDMDTIIKKVVKEHEPMNDKDWKNLQTAFRQMQIFIRNIPHFYVARKHFGGIDADREQLLLDSAERSFRRVTEIIDILNSKGISCTADGKCLQELNAVVTAAEHTFKRVQTKQFNQENEEAYQDVLGQIEEIKKRLA